MTKQTFKVDDIVSIDLSPNYEERLIGVVIDVIDAKPVRPSKEEYPGPWELMWGVPWEGPYPLVKVYVPSIVGINGSSENGYYYMTADHIKNGKIKHSDETLHAPRSKFKVGDRVSYARLISTAKPESGTITQTPTIKNARVMVRWDNRRDEDEARDDSALIMLADAEKESARLNAVAKLHEFAMEDHLRQAMYYLTAANNLMKESDTDLNMYLEARPETLKKLSDVISETCSIAQNEEY